MPSLYGAHVSAAGGVFEAVTRSAEIKGTAFALFLKNEKRWVAKPYTPEVIDQFKTNVETHNYNPRTDVLPHGSYLINLANPNEEMREKSEQAFIDDLQRCELLNVGLYNFHPGSSLGTDRTKAIKNIANGINKAHSATKFVKIVLENMTGNEDRIIGTRLEDLAEIISHVENKSRVGVCIDTCHSFAAGYDMRNQTSFDKFWKKFDDTVGYQYLAGLHLNDSKGPFASKRDLHQNIGLGFLGLEAFRLIMNKPELENVPKILETPHDGANAGRTSEIELLGWLIGKDAEDKEVLEKSLELAAQGAKERKEFEEKTATKTTKRKTQTTFTLTKKAKVEPKPEEDN